MKDMIINPFFIKLTNAAKVSYLLLKAQCCKFAQDEVKFPFSDAEKYMNRNTFSRSIKQLETLGFIEKSFQGGLYRRTNIYKFSEKWKEKK